MSSASANASAAPRRVPGWALVHPLALAAAILIAVNDLWLKPAHSGWWSGKLSDVGICLLLPLVIASVMEWLGWCAARARGRIWSGRPRWVAMLSCALAASYFAALQLSVAFAQLHLTLMRSMVPGLQPRLTMDPSDLIALAAIPLAYRQLRSPA